MTSILLWYVLIGGILGAALACAGEYYASRNELMAQGQHLYDAWGPSKFKRIIFMRVALLWPLVILLFLGLLFGLIKH